MSAWELAIGIVLAYVALYVIGAVGGSLMLLGYAWRHRNAEPPSFVKVAHVDREKREVALRVVRDPDGDET